MADEQNQNQVSDEAVQNPGTEAPETPVAQPEPEVVAEEHHSHLGPILGVLIIALVVILGGLYLWGSTLVDDVNTAAPRPVIENNEPETPRAEADVENINTVSTSDEIAAIEADLESTLLDELDAEMQAIENELNEF